MKSTRTLSSIVRSRTLAAIVATGLAALSAAPVFAWQDLNMEVLDKYAKKASDSVTVSLGPDELQMAANFLGAKDSEEADVKKLVKGLKSIQVRSFTFDKEGQYADQDLQPLRDMLKSPTWSRIVSAKNTKDRENSEIYLRKVGNGKELAGLTIIVTQPKEFTVVQILGNLKMEDMAALRGNFGVPDLNLPTDKSHSSPSKSDKDEKEK